MSCRQGRTHIRPESARPATYEEARLLGHRYDNPESRRSATQAVNLPPFLTDSLRGRIMAATLNGASAAELKVLYIEQNSFQIPEATPIYRIFQFQYLSEDIRKEQLTHVRPKAWGDPLENPLLNHEWREPTG